MSNPLQVLAGILVVFLLPGYTLVCMLFPRKGELDPEYDIIYRITLGMGMSVVIAILVGFGLNAISTAENAYVRAGPLWTVLLLLTLAFTVAGWWRGAYPSAGLIHPSLYRSVAVPGVPRSKGPEFQKKRRLDRLILEREQLLEDLKLFTDRSATSNPQRKLYYRKRMDQARERIDQINEELGSLGPGGK
jgi:hypothetical protein